MFLAEPVFVNIKHKSYCIPRDVMPLMVSNFGCCKQLECIIDALFLSTYLGSFQSYLKSAAAECVVSPANSFGLMDGGLDLALSKYYGGLRIRCPLCAELSLMNGVGSRMLGLA